jgi:threonine synthase
MRYISTRGQAPPVSFLDAVLAGMAPDGGLYVPESWPKPFGDPLSWAMAADQPLSLTSLHTLQGLSGELFDAAMTYNDCTRWPKAVAPLVQTGPGEWMLELFHGPSLSFKDIALQLMGALFEHALTTRDRGITLVCATSGDTGGAAVEAFKNRVRADLFVLTPKGRVSDVQRRFMTTSGAPNVHVLEIDGDFDACQALVKHMFADAAFQERSALSAVNSINFARIAAQAAYYVAASSALGAPGDPTFIVPTGNFGDAYSGWVAKQMGAPVGRIVLATNANDILARAIETGSYERAVKALATLSPAMDIQAPSNFERILFEALDRDPEQLRWLYEQLAESGRFDIPSAALDRLQENFQAVSVSDNETLTAMKSAWNGGVHGYLACPHTATAISVREQRQGWFDWPIVTLATAHPAKFPDTVQRATGVRPALPAKCADLFNRSEKFDSLPADAEAVKQYIRERSRAWS